MPVLTPGTTGTGSKPTTVTPQPSVRRVQPGSTLFRRGVMLMLLMGFVEFRTTLSAMLPAILYLALHTIEGQVVTPIVLGRRMAISPLMLILALMLFGWLWGMVGLLLAGVPVALAGIVAATAGFALRGGAIWYGWKLPAYRRAGGRHSGESRNP